MHPDPTQLGTPVRVVTGLLDLYGITTSSHVEVVGRYVMNYSLFTGQQSRGKEVHRVGQLSQVSFDSDD